MNILRKKPLSRKVLNLTLRYQKKYPGTQDGRPAPGKIAAKKIPEYLRKMTGLVVKDRILRNTFQENFRGRITDEKMERTIIQYALKKARGDKQKAKQFLDTAIKQINEGTEINEIDAIKAAKKQGISEKGREAFFTRLEHMWARSIFLTTALHNAKDEIV